MGKADASVTSAAHAATDARSRDVADRLAIADVIARYPTALDQRDWGLLDRVFTADATVRYGGTRQSGGTQVFRGPREVAANCARSLARYVATQHFLGDCVVSVDGDRATAATYVQATHIVRASDWSEIRVLGGTYHDELVRLDGEWRIHSRWLEMTWEETRGLGPGIARTYDSSRSASELSENSPSTM